MELFDDGGLADEGGTVDPVSGNDVPVGSTQKEVRDDIPAQLSEGEFVLPADVVRYYGLEKIMQMRDEAKAGLARMEAMGQMGNADEAILDDDVPFSIDDLDMEEVQEYNVGGVVQPQGFTGVGGYQQSQFANYQPQFTSYQAPQLTGAYTPPAQQAVPTAPQMAQGQVPTFESFIQPTEGMAPENREYINPQTGEKRTFTFISGNPTVAIPQGFIPVSQYTAPEVTEATKVTPTVGQTTTQDDSGSSEEQRKADAEQRVRIENRISAAKEAGYSKFQDPLSSIAKILIPGSSILGVDTKEEAGTITGTGYVYDGKGGLVDPLTGRSVSTSLIDSVKKTFMYDNYTRDVLRKAEAAESEVGRNLQQKVAEREVENKYKNLIENATTPEDRNYIAAVRDEIKKEAEKGNVSTEGKIINPFEASAPEPQRDDSNDDNIGGGTSISDILSSAPTSSSNEDYAREAFGFSEGGNVTKQMKKSGLTSKK